MGDRKISIVAKVFDQQGCIAYLCKTPNEAAMPAGEPWKHSERMGFKSLFWILLKFTLSMPHTPTLKT